MNDLISRQAAIDALCAVCGNDCDKSEFVYNAPQDEQVILCPEHYCLCMLPSVQPDIIYCKDCKNCQIDGVFHAYWCDGRRVLKDHYCGYAERRTNEQTVSE